MKIRTTVILSLTAILTLAACSAFGAYSGGTGEPNNPYQIATKADLLTLAATTADYGKCFILTADVNMAGQVFTTAIIAADTNVRAGFQGASFTGTFDGNDHKVTHFTINGGSNWFLGLFGEIQGGSVRNLGIENFNVSGSSDSYNVSGLVGFSYGGNISGCYSTGSVSGSSYVGGLVGFSYGSISDCYSTGSVSGSSDSSPVGGLVGENYGSISNCFSTCVVSGATNSWYTGGLVGANEYYGGIISNCHSTGTVSGYNGVGGLVGNSGGTISNCYSVDDVIGNTPDSYYAGGLVGASQGDISNCYSTGTVNGYNRAGGLVGENQGDISSCYSMSAVSGSFQVGGLVGVNSGGSVDNSFWGTQTSGQTISDGGTGKTTAQMKTFSTFTSAGWDFVYMWGIGNGQTYPYLKPFNGINPADLNYSGRVNFVDFAIFAANWLSSE